MENIDWQIVSQDLVVMVNQSRLLLNVTTCLSRLQFSRGDAQASAELNHLIFTLPNNLNRVQTVEIIKNDIQVLNNVLASGVVNNFATIQHLYKNFSSHVSFLEGLNGLIQSFVAFGQNETEINLNAFSRRWNTFLLKDDESLNVRRYGIAGEYYLAMIDSFAAMMETTSFALRERSDQFADEYGRLSTLKGKRNDNNVFEPDKKRRLD